MSQLQMLWGMISKTLKSKNMWLWIALGINTIGSQGANVQYTSQGKQMC